MVRSDRRAPNMVGCMEEEVACRRLAAVEATVKVMEAGRQAAEGTPEVPWDEDVGVWK
jgi:hypothetical protein